LQWQLVEIWKDDWWRRGNEGANHLVPFLLLFFSPHAALCCLIIVTTLVDDNVNIHKMYKDSNVFALQRPPPLSTEPDRCEKAHGGNTIGQANGVYDKPIDLRFCDYTNDKSKLNGKSLAAALMSDAKFDGADTSEVVVSKAYAVGASFKGNFSVQPSSIFCDPLLVDDEHVDVNFSWVKFEK